MTDGERKRDASSDASGGCIDCGQDAKPAATNYRDVGAPGNADAEGRAPAPKGGTAVVRVTNNGQASLFVRYDSVGDPDWTTIFGLNLNPVGESFCGTAEHNEPGDYSELLGAGATLEFTWKGQHYESRAAGADACWRLIYADPGSYPAEVCVLTQNVPLVPISQVDASGVTVCKPIAIDLPASGEKTLVVTFAR